MIVFFYFFVTFIYFYFFFFFQAEDGIRDLYVTGVQTCALPIYSNPEFFTFLQVKNSGLLLTGYAISSLKIITISAIRPSSACNQEVLFSRSEERRVGKECRSRWSAYH